MITLELKNKSWPAGAPNALLDYSVAEALTAGQLASHTKGVRLISGESGQSYDFLPLTPAELTAKKHLNTYEGVLYSKYHQLFATDPTLDEYGVLGAEQFDLTRLILNSPAEFGEISHLYLADDFFAQKWINLLVADHEPGPKETQGLTGIATTDFIATLASAEIMAGVNYLPDIVRHIKQSWPQFDSRVGTIIPHSLYIIETTNADLPYQLQAQELPCRCAETSEEARLFWRFAREARSLK